MAIDTRDKRASAIGLPTFWIAPIPDGTIDAADRLQIAGLYRGIAAVAGIVWTAAGSPYRLFLFTAANWAVNAFVAEAMVRATTGTAYLRIYNEDGTVAIAGSQGNTASGTFVRLRISSVALTDGKQHRLQFGTEAGDDGEAYGGVLIWGA